MGIKRKVFGLLAFLGFCLPAIAQNASHEYRVALILPFHSKGGNVTLRNAMLDYYEGFKIAAENLQPEGLNLKLYVFDNMKDSGALQQILDHPDLPKMDVIVGPVYDNNIDTVSEFCDKHGILFVSPLRYYRNPKPGHPLINFYVPDTVKLKSQVEQMHSYFPYHHFAIANDNSIQSLINAPIIRRMLKKAGHKNVPILDYNKTFVSTSKLPEADDSLIIFSATDDNKIKPTLEKLVKGKRSSYLIAPFEWYDKLGNAKDIHHPQIIYSSFNFIDTKDSATRAFKKDFKYRYLGQPSKYAYIGYDQGTYIFYGLMAYNNKFYNYLPNACYQGLVNCIKLESTGKDLIENRGFFFLQSLHGKRQVFRP